MFHPKHVLSSLKNELQKHCMVHQSDISLRTAMKPWYYYYHYHCYYYSLTVVLIGLTGMARNSNLTF